MTLKVILCLVLIIVCGVDLQLVDEYNPIVYEDPNAAEASRSSYFGFSLLLKADNSSKWLIVGAPRSNNSMLKDVKEPGEVYLCMFKGPCRYLDIGDRETAYFRVKADRYPEMKDGSWLGGSMALDPGGNKLAVCAHRRYVDHSPLRIVAGSCYVSDLNNPRNSLHLRPLLDSRRITKEVVTPKRTNVVYEFGMAQLGTSMYFTSVAKPQDFSDLVLGAPGVMNSRGAPVLMTRNGSVNLYASSPMVKSSDFEKVIVPSIGTDVFLDGDYLGYSGTSGYFYGINRGVYHVASAPRSHRYRGKVAIFKFPKTTDTIPMIKQDLNGDQVGCYFGAALEAADINGDNLDDLLIGAPYGREPKVHIYLGSERHQVFPPSESQTKYLTMPQWGKRSQFGIAIRAVDLNNDQYFDVIVGAPEAEGSGAIAIFMGSSAGLEKSPSQIIIGSQVFFDRLKGFGMFMSNPADMDDNNYPDIAIGSYKSGHAVVLRTIPEAHLKAELKLHSKDSTKIVVNACVMYHRKRNFQTSSNITVVRTISLKNNDSIGLAGDKYFTKDIIVQEWQVSCQNVTFNLLKELRNYLIPLEITVRFTKKYKEANIQRHVTFISGEKVSDDDNFDKWDPRIVNPNEGIQTLAVPLHTNCGGDNICWADLFISGRFPQYQHNGFILGSTDTIILEIEVINRGESAYNTEARIMLPPEISLTRLPATCRTEDEIICKIGNPLLNGTSRTLLLEINMKRISENIFIKEMKEFIITGTTASNEVNPIDNVAKVNLTLDVDSRISLTGMGFEGSYSRNETLSNHNTTLSHEFVEFIHLYEVRKAGVSNVDEVNLIVNVPLYYQPDEEKKIEFLKIYEPEGTQNGQPYTCERTNYGYALKNTKNKDGNEDSFLGMDSAARSKRSAPEYFKPLRSLTQTGVLRVKREIKETNMTELPANATLFLSCRKKGIICHTISCRIGPFRKSQDLARLRITMSMNISSLKEHMMGVKSIIAYSTHGAASIVVIPGNVVEAEVRSIFVSSPAELKVAMWIILLSVILGLLLVLLLMGGLMKAGFFQRKTKDKLELLKKAEAEKNDKEDLVSESLDEVDIEHLSEDNHNQTKCPMVNKFPNPTYSS